MKSCLKVPLFTAGVMLFFLFSTITCSGITEAGSNNQPHKVDSVLKNLPDINLDYISLIQGVKHQLSLTGYFFENLHELPNLSESVCSLFVSSQHDVQTLFHFTFQMLSASAGGFGPPLPGIGQSRLIRCQEELTQFFELPGIKLIQKQEWEKLPFSLKKAIVEMLITINEARIIFEQFAKPFKEYLSARSAFSAAEMYDALIIPWNQRELTDFSPIELINNAELTYLSLATRKLTDKLNWFIMQNELQIPEDFSSCTILTSMGELFINGIKNDTIKGGQFFTVDLGGDDVYLENTACTVSADQPFGIVIDLGGNDKYLCDEHFLVAGILGVGILLDLGGDDLYQTGQSGLAFSLYGSSLLYDSSGNDTYIGKKHTQGAAYIGSSILADISGNDNYSCQANSQAFGGTLGVGILFDNRGNDLYNTTGIRENEDVFSQSFILGAAKGRWAEATDGQSLAGGIGVFIDNSGIDDYMAGSFSQGASYYFGLGLFNDIDGDDKYNAVSHSQGYAAHYSLGGFFEYKGDDSYNVWSDKGKITQIIGGGRDFSCGLFIDFYGDDTYHFGNRSAGIGDIKGVGLLADFSGDDKYIWHKNPVNAGIPSLGKKPGLGNSMDIGFKIFQPKDAVHKGIFIDADGKNSFKINMQ